MLGHVVILGVGSEVPHHCFLRLLHGFPFPPAPDKVTVSLRPCPRLIRPELSPCSKDADAPRHHVLDEWPPPRIYRTWDWRVACGDPGMAPGGDHTRLTEQLWPFHVMEPQSHLLRNGSVRPKQGLGSHTAAEPQPCSPRERPSPLLPRGLHGPPSTPSCDVSGAVLSCPGTASPLFLDRPESPYPPKHPACHWGN